MEESGQDRVERRLAAILAADVVGYSRLMGVDEEGTLARLKAHQRALVEPKIAEHHGRIVKTTGDGALVEFASVVDAVRCAVEIQRGMAERNADVPQERRIEYRIEYRIGINVGDIIIDGADIFGDGVNVAARLGSQLQKAEVDLSAYDYFLRGRALRQTGAKGRTLESRALFEKAIEIDRKFAMAYAELAYTYYREIALRWDVANRERSLAKGVELAEKAVALDATLPCAHLVRGDLYLRQHQFDQAVTWVKKAIDLDPNDPENYAALANVFNFINRNGKALPLIQKAIALDPLHDPALDMYLGKDYNFIGKFEQAIPPLRNCVSRGPDFWPCHANLAAAYAHSGKLDLARQELTELRRYYPVKSVKQYRDQGSNQPGPETERVYKGLALAGLPAE